ncbi:ATP-binding protein [Anaerococcus sp.]|uniref:ATP-binding protein n=1 Tax=Anaerococcus sp. TaxID=1872515 RepID=UPI0027B9D4A5|nr:AAA family ATPase [Anaerococcus sp.]
MTRVFIKEIHMISFGKFEDKKIKFNENFNLIYGKNETGKSTLANFIEGLLYGFDEGKNKRSFSDKKEVYKPKLSYKYAGSGIFNKDGLDIKVIRNFEDGSYKLINLSSGEEIPSKDSNLGFPGEYILDMNYDIYKNYLTSFQGQRSEQKAKEKLIESLANQDIDYDFSANKAIGILDDKLNKLGSDRAYTKPYLKVKTEIKEIEDRLYEIKSYKKSYEKDFKRLDYNKKRQKSLREKYEKDKEKLDSYKKYRANQNYKDYKRWTDELYKINESIGSYSDVFGLDEEYFLSLEENLGQSKKSQSSNMRYIVFVLVLIFIFLGFSINKYFYILALSFMLVFIFLINSTKKTEDSRNDLSQFNKLRARFLKYKSLKKEKEKIEDVLSILRNQDIKDSESTFDLEDFENYDIEKAELSLDSYLENLDKINVEISRDEKNLVSIEEKIEDEVDLVDRLHFLEDKLVEIENKKRAINLAKSTIKKIIDENRNDFTNLNKRANQIIREISKNSFDSIIFDEKLNPKIRTKEGYDMMLDQLSKGFMDQLSFALKLSINEEAFSKIFMVYDDAFINYDLERLRNALFFLLDAASFRQIIYFTCHDREKEVFESEGIEINYIDMEDV